MRHAQRGVIAAIYLYGIAAIAALGALYGIYYTIDSRADARGYQRAQVEYAEATAKAQRQEDADAQLRHALGERMAAELEAAQRKASDANARWHSARAAADRKGVPLDVCDRPAQPPGPGPRGQVAAADAAGAVRFTHQLLAEWDSSWVGARGQPVFGDTGELIARSQHAGADPADVGTRELLENHKRNAERCSGDRATLEALTRTVRTLREQWDKAHPTGEGSGAP